MEKRAVVLILLVAVAGLFEDVGLCARTAADINPAGVEADLQAGLLDRRGEIGRLTP